MSNREVIEDVLYNCQNEIGELKDVVIDSRKSIILYSLKVFS